MAKILFIYFHLKGNMAKSLQLGIVLRLGCTRCFFEVNVDGGQQQATTIT